MVLTRCTTFNTCAYLYAMKKNVIWFVGLVMAVCCMGLIYMQVSYIDAMVRMRRQHFEEGVKRSLNQTAYNAKYKRMAIMAMDSISNLGMFVYTLCLI